MSPGTLVRDVVGFLGDTLLGALSGNSTPSASTNDSGGRTNFYVDGYSPMPSPSITETADNAVNTNLVDDERAAPPDIGWSFGGRDLIGEGFLQKFLSRLDCC
jgi:hypothetical protein